MMTELVLVEGVSDVQLISYYLQNVYGWKHENSNTLGIVPLDKHEHIESLSKDDSQLVLCGVGGNGKFAYFVEQHRVNSLITEQDCSSERMPEQMQWTEAVGEPRWQMEPAMVQRR